MREIKFRGKRVDSGEWVYGYYVSEPDNKYYILADMKFDYWIIDPETVGEFIGLTDKNGVEIYESDIVKSTALANDHHQKGNIERFIVNHFMGNFCLKFLNSESCSPIYPIIVSHDIEVIGNIHQNADLLTEEE